MKIARVEATPLYVNFNVDVLGLDETVALSMCFVEVETDDGVTGHGITAITDEMAVAAAVNDVAAPYILGDDPMAHEAVWDKLYWHMTPRGQTGYAMHAIAAIDVALWDIKGKVLNQPVWRLLGGARNNVPVYATFGFGFFDNDHLGEAAKLWHSNGFDGLKMTVGMNALKRRDEPRSLLSAIREDLKRVQIVREAVGMDAELYIDANCSLDPYHAIKLAHMLEPYDIAFFEEPINANDVRQMADMRRQTNIPIACGQNEGLAYRFRDMMISDAIDVAQPNVVITGGYTQVAKIAGMAQAFNVSIDNGGAWPFHNMHLHAGLSNGGLVECHYVSIECCKRVFKNLPEPANGRLTLPETPGLGFEPDFDMIRDISKRPGKPGSGKG